MSDNQYTQKVEHARKEYDKLYKKSHLINKKYNEFKDRINIQKQELWNKLAEDLANKESELKAIKDPVYEKFREISNRMGELRNIFEDRHECENCGKQIGD